MRIVQRSTAAYFVWGTSLLVAACSGAKPSSENDTKPPLAEVPPLGPRPELGPVVQQDDPPPPISGGTLASARTQSVAVAADSDRDRVYVVDLALRSVRHTIQLAPKSEPGRVALDNGGRAHVALRNSAEVATIDLATGSFIVRRACTSPRGIAFDAKAGVVYVSCATGEVVTLPPALGEVTRRMDAGRDIRDIVVTGRGLRLTRFRAATMLALQASTGHAGNEQQLGMSNLAWRAVAAPSTPPGATGEPDDSDATAIVTQEPAPEPVSPEPGGYGGGGGGKGFECGGVGIVSTRLWLVGDGMMGSMRLPTAVLPVDVAAYGRELVVVAAGNAHTKELPQLFVVDRDQVANGFQEECGSTIVGNVPGQAVAATFDDKGELIVQTREPAALHIMTDDRQRVWKTIALAPKSKADTGHVVFHSNAGNNIACASCHAEGGDDGHIWEFVGMGPRRTPSLLGTTQHTEPFHWSGDMKDLSTLVDHVFVERMGGPRMDKAQVDVLGNFLFKLPAPPKLRAEADAPPAGKDLFQQRCSSCHNGALLTNNKSVDVGTGGEFQVPSLVGVGWRAPYLHTGCAKTLFDRFDPACGGAAHADTKDLSQNQIADLVGFLETL